MSKSIYIYIHIFHYMFVQKMCSTHKQTFAYLAKVRYIPSIFFPEKTRLNLWPSVKVMDTSDWSCGLMPINNF